MKDIFRDILGVPGVEPGTDATPQSTQHFTFADKIRFIDGRPWKIGGWESFLFDDDHVISGCTRAIFSYYTSGSVQYLIGTDTHLYHLLGSQLTNITPLVTSTTAIANSLATYYKTLANNPITTVSGSNIITIADASTKIRAGDVIVLSGSSTVNGIPDTEINAAHFVRTQTTNSYTVQVTSNASSSGAGGGAIVVQTTPIITVTQNTHGRANGDRIKITDAAATGGIPNTEINAEHIIRSVTTNTMDIVVLTDATSSVSGGGGASTKIQGQIPVGECDASFGTGYGLGEYGVGLYGVPKTSDNATLPRVWSFDNYGTDVIMTPGDQLGTYIWDNDITEAPALLTNAPTAINYVFVSNNIVVTLGEGGTENRIKASDNVDITIWTGAATNQAFANSVAQASRFLSSAPARGLVLLFTQKEVFTFRYINRPFVWDIELIDDDSGIISQNARVSYNGVVYWMADNNFYMYKGGSVQIIPSNTTSETTLKHYVFDDINYGQKSKAFGWFNSDYNEVWFHYPSANSNECDRIARININEMTHTPDTMDRSAAEYPSISGRYPYLISSDNTLYQHEIGKNDDGAPMAFELRTPFYNAGKNKANLRGIVPDSIQTEDIAVALNFKDWPQSAIVGQLGPYDITPTTPWLDFQTAGRYWQYEITGDALDQEFGAGAWQEMVSEGSRQ